MSIGILVDEKFLRQKTPNIRQKNPQNPKNKTKDCLHRIYMFPTHASEYYLNTIISLYFKCLVFKHYY